MGYPNYFRDLERTAERLKEKRRVERLQRRAKRRAEGNVIRPEPVARCFSDDKLDFRDIRLRGYDALQSIFPDTSKEALIYALRSAQDLPCSRRAAAASTNLLESKKVYVPHSRPRSASPVAGHKGIRTVPPAPLLLRAVTQPVQDCPEASLGLFGAYYAAALMSNDPLDPPPNTEAPCGRHPTHVFSERASDNRNSTQPAWRRSKTQEWKDEAIPICSERWRKKHRFHFTKYRRLRKDRRSYVDDRLLHAEPPSLGVLMAVEIAKSTAAAVAQANAEEQGHLGEMKDSHPWASWNALQHKFLDEHGQSIRNELGEQVQITPVHPHNHVQDEFLASCSAAETMPLPAYHGTKARNISSISLRGLLIPGHGGVTVAHGSAHGLGIYTARLGSSFLSKQFIDSDKMFICGVCDGPNGRAQQQLASRRGLRPAKWTHGVSLHHRQHRAPVSANQAQQKMLGNFRLHKDTGAVRHVGNALVVFDEARVAPLFLASGVAYSSLAPVTRWPGWNSSVVQLWPGGIPENANHGARSERVGTRQILIQETKVLVWLPPEAVTCKEQIRTKRRFERKRKDLRRRKDREEKVAMQSFYSDQVGIT